MPVLLLASLVGTDVPTGSMSRLLAVLDQGTTNTKALLVREDGSIAASATSRVELTFPQPGWAESDALAIWHSAVDALIAVLDQAPAQSVVGIGITNQRESVVLWDAATSEPCGPMVSWQCTRGIGLTAAAVQRAARSERGPEVEWVQSQTGLPLDPMFSASKLGWLLAHTPAGNDRAAAGELRAGTLDSWLVWQLSGRRHFVTDASNASRTLLMDLRRCCWDAELAALFGVPLACLPTIVPSASVIGEVSLVHPSLARDAVIAAVAGDSHAALVGHRVFRPGSVKATFGTGTSVMAPVASVVQTRRLAGTIAWSAEQQVAGRVGLAPLQHAVEGNIVATGAALEWTASLLGHGLDVGALERQATSVPDCGGLAFVPALAGLGAPHWDASARGTISGLTRGSTAGHIARATFDSVGHQVADVFDVLDPKSEGQPAVGIREVHADGGAMQSDLLAQTVADVTGTTVLRSTESEVAARGVAWLAGLTLGIWPNVESLPDRPAPAVFDPQWTENQRAEQRGRWAEAVKRTMS